MSAPKGKRRILRDCAAFALVWVFMGRGFEGRTLLRTAIEVENCEMRRLLVRKVRERTFQQGIKHLSK